MNKWYAMLEWYDIHMIILFILCHSVTNESAHVQLFLYDDMHTCTVYVFYEICYEKYSSRKK